MSWYPTGFEVRVEPAAPGRGEYLVSFPSPLGGDTPHTGVVTMEWYLARGPDGKPRRAPGVVVVHESGRGMTVGRLIARDFPRHGVHACLIHLPHYGERSTPQGRPNGAAIVTALQQAVTDVRRARDAMAALPWVENDNIFLQGTSLGGIVSSTVAGLDRGYSGYFLLLAGGDLHSILMHGDRDAAKLRRELSSGGLEGEPLRQLARTIEPLRLAHRADPDRVWLYAAKYDTVVPPANSDRLARAFGLDESHYRRMTADHYTGIVQLPWVMREMAQEMWRLSR
ncbi:MAG: hypothetical protein R3B90_11445 [Planctomycetaceae bacterium]